MNNNKDDDLKEIDSWTGYRASRELDDNDKDGDKASKLKLQKCKRVGRITLRKQIVEDKDLSSRRQPSTTSSSRMIPFSSMIQTPTTAMTTPFSRNTGTANADDDNANKASSKVTTPNNIE